ncbi:MAG: hypothetical protein WCQ55_08075 [Paludibacteraceae bacterium]|nr:hypothetical protein [Prevotellaceae bacterium]
MSRLGKLRQSGFYSIYKGQSCRLDRSSEISNIRLWGNEPIIFLSSPTELTSAYEMDVYMEADGYKLYNWGYNKENDLSVLSVNEEEVKHSQCDMIDIIIVELFMCLTIG